MPAPSQLTDDIGHCIHIKPQVFNGTSFTAGPIDMSKFRRAMFIVAVGDASNGGVITMQLYEDVSAAFVTATAVAATGAVQTNFSTSNKVITFDVRGDLLTKRYLGLTITETTESFDISVSCVGFGYEPIQNPGSKQNSTVVSQQNVLAPV